MLWWLQAGELKCEQHQSLGQMVYYLVFHYYDKISEKINLQRGKFYFGGFSVWLLGPCFGPLVTLYITGFEEC
jgi:hypothetical protein